MQLSSRCSPGVIDRVEGVLSDWLAESGTCPRISLLPAQGSSEGHTGRIPTVPAVALGKEPEYLEDGDMPVSSVVRLLIEFLCWWISFRNAMRLLQEFMGTKGVLEKACRAIHRMKATEDSFKIEFDVFGLLIENRIFCYGIDVRGAEPICRDSA